MEALDLTSCFLYSGLMYGMRRPMYDIWQTSNPLVEVFSNRNTNDATGGLFGRKSSSMSCSSVHWALVHSCSHENDPRSGQKPPQPPQGWLANIKRVALPSQSWDVRGQDVPRNRLTYVKIKKYAWWTRWWEQLIILMSSLISCGQCRDTILYCSLYLCFVFIALSL